MGQAVSLTCKVGNDLEGSAAAVEFLSLVRRILLSPLFVAGRRLLPGGVPVREPWEPSGR